jgi:hypothetical protein
VSQLAKAATQFQTRQLRAFRSMAMTRRGFIVSKANVFSPAEAIDRHVSSGWTSSAPSRTSASSQHWA